MSQRGRSVVDTSKKWTPSQKATFAIGVAMVALLAIVSVVTMPPPSATPLAAAAIAKATIPVIDPMVQKVISSMKLHRSAKRKKAVRRRSAYTAWRLDTDNLLFGEDQEWNPETGLTQCQFRTVCTLVQSSVNGMDADARKKAPRYFSVIGAVGLTCVFLRTGDSYGSLASRYDASISTTRRTIVWMLTHMRASLNFVNFDKVLPLGGFAAEYVIGSIDCTTHRRDRVHPGEDTFYRPDKGFHFLSSQLVVDHFGFILRISVAKGRNNDSAIFKLTKMADFLLEKGWQLLGDLGYGSVQVLKPIGREYARSVAGSKEYNRHQASERAMVENVNSWFKQWQFCEKRCKLQPTIQAMGLVVCASLYNLCHVPTDDRIDWICSRTPLDMHERVKEWILELIAQAEARPEPSSSSQ